jgi:NitT/TauT family transport system substrate-binding protein
MKYLKLSQGVIVCAAAALAIGMYYVTARTPPKETAQRHIVLQLNWLPEGSHAFLYLGKEDGIFLKYGFDIEMQGGRGSELAAKLLASGRADVAFIGGDALVMAINQGANIRSAGIVYPDTPVVIYSKRDKGITHLSDLYGHKLGLIPGSNTTRQYNIAAGIQKLDASRIDEIKVDGAIAPSLLLSDKIDALANNSYEAPLQAAAAGISVNEIYMRDYGVEVVGMSMAVRTGTFTTEELGRLRGALKDSLIAAMANPTAAFSALQKANPNEAYANQGDAVEVDYQKHQVTEVLSLMCPKEVDASCPEFLQNDRSAWSKTIKTLESSGMLSGELAEDGIIVKDSAK